MPLVQLPLTEHKDHAAAEETEKTHCSYLQYKLSYVDLIYIVDTTIRRNNK